MHYYQKPGAIKLSGFNNLTKALSFNIYDFCVAENETERDAYFKYINERYHKNKITEVLKGICGIIEAEVLAVSDRDYDPWGASSLVLMSDIKGGGDVAMHLDKSHVCAHTYPDIRNGVCSIRVDIDIATCGEISPLKALNYMFEQFDSDVVVIDYVVRGFTRDDGGKRVYMDHPLRSIQDYIDSKITDDYYCLDLALERDLIWQTKMLRTNLNVQEYFLDKVDVKSDHVKKKIEDVKTEMRGVLHMFPD